MDIQETPTSLSVNIRPHEVVNPIHLAFKKALLPVLLENTKTIRDRLSLKTTRANSPNIQLFAQAIREWSQPEHNALLRAFGALYDELTESPTGTGKKLLASGSKADTNPFMPLSVIVPMRSYDGHNYMPRTPYIVVRAESQAVVAMHEEGLNVASFMHVVGTKAIPASDEEVQVCVDTLNTTQLAELMLHEYCRPIFNTMMGVGDDSDDSDEEETPF